MSCERRLDEEEDKLSVTKMDEDEDEDEEEDEEEDE